MELTAEQLAAFLSKKEFDFSTPEGWREFLDERSLGGTGRDADGIHVRDLNNYAVGVVTLCSVGRPITVHYTIRTHGGNHSIPPGNLYIFHPDANWNYSVTGVNLGSRRPVHTYSHEVAGGGSKTRPEWGSLYYIAEKTGLFPGQGAAKKVGNSIVKDALKESAWLLRRGARLLSFAEVGYVVQLRIGREVTNTYFLPQKVLSESAEKKIREMSDAARKKVDAMLKQLSGG